MGIDFSYQPPPRNVVPYAASLKAQPPRCAPSHSSVAVMERPVCGGLLGVSVAPSARHLINSHVPSWPAPGQP